jgi:hypothetical protein
MSADSEGPLLVIPLPGGRVARVPLALLERYVDPTARAEHGVEDGASLDVSAHDLKIDHATGASTWHTEWELGQCDFVDDGGFPQTAYTWHRHPLGTEYTETFPK